MPSAQSTNVTKDQIDATNDLDRLLSIEVSAGILGVSVWTVRKWISDGKIKSAKLGSRRLIPVSALKRFIDDAMIESRC